MSARRYFPGQNQRLQEVLDSYLGWLHAEASALPELRALLLGGGYGRGEGGVFEHQDGGEATLFNDVEFYLFAGAVPSGAVERWVHEGESRLGIDVEFKTMSPQAFAGSRPSMFYYDLLARHILVAGDEGWAASLRPELSDPALLPADEASRLLVNRGVSLLRCFRWARGEVGLPAGFCARIVGKLKLALADAVLCAQGLYHWSCIERDRRLASVSETPPDWPELTAWHAEGVTFKLHPHRRDGQPEEQLPVLEDLRRAWLGTFLWIESRRLGASFGSAEDYGAFRGRLFPDEGRWGNVLRQVRDLRRPERLPFSASDHPRAAIWRSLVLLLGGERAGEASAGRLLGAEGLRGRELEERCRACWRHYP